MCMSKPLINGLPSPMVFELNKTKYVKKMNLLSKIERILEHLEEENLIKILFQVPTNVS